MPEPDHKAVIKRANKRNTICHTQALNLKLIKNLENTIV
jgi:hypothetical protein